MALLRPANLSICPKNATSFVIGYLARGNALRDVCHAASWMSREGEQVERHPVGHMKVRKPNGIL